MLHPNLYLSQINWHILGPNSEELLPALNSDIGRPVNGSFYFEDGEGGLRSINLEIYAYEEVEVQETYVIRLSVVKGETELDPEAANIILTVNHTFFLIVAIELIHPNLFVFPALYSGCKP